LNATIDFYDYPNDGITDIIKENKEENNAIYLRRVCDMETGFKLPHVGQRIIRSVCAVCLCFIVYFMRGCHGIPFYSALAVLQCMQPYRSSSLKMAKKRSIGTFIGAFWGFLVILIQIYVLDGAIMGTFLNYMLISLFTGVVIYSTVVMNCKNNSYFSCVVFLSIVVMHIEDAHPFIFVLNRVVDTLIGVFLALIVNSVHLPRGKNTDVLYVSGIEDVMFTGREPLTDYSKVELNRIIDTGANFTVATIKTPASVMESLNGINLKLPIIAMDGAVLYDIKENKYLKTYPMSYKQAEKIMQILRNENVNFFINVVVEDALIIYYHHLENEAETQIYKQMRRSPHRNYVRRNLPEGEEVVYFMMIDKTEKIREIYQRLTRVIQKEEYKMISYESSHYPGYSYIKIYEKDVTRSRMTRYLAEQLGIKKITTFGSIPGKSDVLVKDSDKNIMVKELKKRFEPVKVPWKKKNNGE